MMAGLNLSQTKNLIVQPVCTILGHAEPAAVNLVTGTMLAESDGEYLQQLNGGPALSLWEVEKNTHDDVWRNYLAFRPDLAQAVQSLMSPRPRYEQLVTNLAYAVAICRVIYMRADPPLPAFDDPVGLSRYHKAWYNTAGGAADAAANVPKFLAAINA